MRLNPVLYHRPEQILLGREMAVDGASTDTGPSGDLVDRHAQPVGGEGLIGDLQHPSAITRRVGAQRPGGLSHLTLLGNR